MIRTALKEERSLFANKIREQLNDKAQVNFIDLKKAINTIDETINEKLIDKIAQWCFNSEKQADLNLFNKRVENCSLFFTRKLI